MKKFFLIAIFFVFESEVFLFAQSLKSLQIEKYIDFSPYEKDDFVLNEKNYKVKVSDVAKIAISSGCPKEFMPLCTAFVKSISDEWLLQLNSNRSCTVIALVNGAYCKQVGLDFGPGAATNAENRAFSHFIECALKEIAKIKIGKNCAFGAIMPVVLCEDEDALKKIGWLSYHQEKGFSQNDSALTVSTIFSWGNNITPATSDAKKTMELIAFDITEKCPVTISNNEIVTNGATIFLTEPVAKNLCELYKTKSELCATLKTFAVRPLCLFAYENYFSHESDDVRKNFSFEQYYKKILEFQNASIAEVPDWYKKLLRKKNINAIFSVKDEDLRIFVLGDESRNKVQVMPSGKAKTVKIDLPENWPSLLSSLGKERDLCQMGACPIF